MVAAKASPQKATTPWAGQNVSPRQGLSRIEGLPVLFFHDFNVSKVTHPHPKRVAGRLNSSGDSDHFPLEILERLEGALLCVVAETADAQRSNKLATILEVDVVADRVCEDRTTHFDRSDLELDGDILLGHPLDGFFGGQHLGGGLFFLGLRLLRGRLSALEDQNFAWLGLLGKSRGPIIFAAQAQPQLVAIEHVNTLADGRTVRLPAEVDLLGILTGIKAVVTRNRVSVMVRVTSNGAPANPPLHSLQFTVLIHDDPDADDAFLTAFGGLQLWLDLLLLARILILLDGGLPLLRHRLFSRLRLIEQPRCTSEGQPDDQHHR